jgi:hypothetical protein
MFTLLRYELPTTRDRGSYVVSKMVIPIIHGRVDGWVTVKNRFD